VLMKFLYWFIIFYALHHASKSSSFLIVASSIQIKETDNLAFIVFE